MRFFYVRSSAELENLINEIGFLPFFRNRIKGFSVEECTPREFWFVDGVDGPWEWKGEIAARKETAYGKLFDKKSGYVSRRWYPDFANFRRDGYDFDARWEEGLAPRKHKEIIDMLALKDTCLSSDLKRFCGLDKPKSGFDSAINALQMQTYIAVAAFEYRRDRYGIPYGWGTARYTLTENMYGEDFVTSAYDRKPEESKSRIEKHFSKVLKDAGADEIERILRR